MHLVDDLRAIPLWYHHNPPQLELHTYSWHDAHGKAHSEHLRIVRILEDNFEQIKSEVRPYGHRILYVSINFVRAHLTGDSGRTRHFVH